MKMLGTSAGCDLSDQKKTDVRNGAPGHRADHPGRKEADIHKAVDPIRVGDAERDSRLVGRRSAADVENHPDIRELKVPRCVAVTQAQNACAEDLYAPASLSE